MKVLFRTDWEPAGYTELQELDDGSFRLLDIGCEDGQEMKEPLRDQSYRPDQHALARFTYFDLVRDLRKCGCQVKDLTASADA